MHSPHAARIGLVCIHARRYLVETKANASLAFLEGDTLPSVTFKNEAGYREARIRVPGAVSLRVAIHESSRMEAYQQLFVYPMFVLGSSAPADGQALDEESETLLDAGNALCVRDARVRFPHGPPFDICIPVCVT